MTRHDLIEHAAMIISNVPELKECRKVLYWYYEKQPRPSDRLLVECLQRYYTYIDIRVMLDDIEFHLWGEDELGILNDMLFESYKHPDCD